MSGQDGKRAAAIEMADPLVRVTDRVTLGTKSESLQQLAVLVTGARVLPLHRVPYDNWCFDRDSCLDAISAVLGAETTLIVRSSARIEGAKGAALSGAYRSVLGVDSREALSVAIDAVFASYEPPRAGDEVLIQPQLTGAKASGVATSIDPNSGAPYRVISWAAGPDTTLVTAGKSDAVRTWYC
ncbi:MAG: PEP/pyruvate-binding domain-containing protein [Gammaproteobacteria bacterium]